MEKNKSLLFVFSVVAIILGVTLFKQFDFKTLKFEKPALAVLYMIFFLFSVYYVVTNSKNKSEKDK